MGDPGGADGQDSRRSLDGRQPSVRRQLGWAGPLSRYKQSASIVSDRVDLGAPQARLPKRAAKEDVAMLIGVAHYDVACGRVERDEATVGADAGTGAHATELVSDRRDTETRCGGAEHVMEEGVGSLVGVAGRGVG